MLKSPLLYVIVILFFTITHAKSQSIKGQVVSNSSLPLSDVTIRIQKLNKTILSGKNGDFEFKSLLEGSYEIEFSYVGFKPEKKFITLKSELIFLKVILQNQTELLDSVEINKTKSRIGTDKQALNTISIDRNFIHKNLGGSLMQSLEKLPGVKTIGIGSGQSKPLIRGLGFNRVVVVENGIKHEGQQWGADHGLEIDQFAVDRLEVVKGAASFIYGSDAIAGAIDIRPNETPQKNTLNGSIEAIGKSNNKLYGGSINLAGRNDKWFLATRYTYLNYADYKVPTDVVQVYNYTVNLQNNQLRNTAGLENNFHFNTGIITDQFRSVLYFSNTFTKSGFFANAHGLEPRNVDVALHDASDRDILTPYQQVNHFKLINRSSYQFNQHKFDLELGYQKNFREEFSPYINHGYMPVNFSNHLGISSDLERAFNKQVFSANLKDEFTAGNHSFITGINLEQQKNAINGWSFLVPAFKQLTAGAFIYDQFKINEQLQLQAALRYDYGQIHISKYQDWFPSTNNSNFTESDFLIRAEDLRRTFNSLTWSVGANYTYNQFAVKVNIGKSFRMPIAKELAANGVNYHYFSYEKGNNKLSPEESYQLDLGLSWENKKWRLQFNPYYNYFPNYIYLNPTARHDYHYGAGNQVFEYTQSSVMRYGAELQIKYQLLKNLSTELLAEYLYSQQLSGDKTGYTLPFSPPPSAIVNLTYQPKLRKVFSNTYFSIDYRFNGKQNRIVPPEKKTEASQVINIGFGGKIKINTQVIDISFQAQNLFNTKYLNHTSFYRLIELPEMGRNLVVSVKIPFSLKKND